MRPGNSHELSAPICLGASSGWTVTSHDRLWARIIADCATGIDGIHGMAHWGAVQTNGYMLLQQIPGVIPAVVNLFAILHDSQRVCDGRDDGHGARAAEYAASLRTEGLFEISDEHFQLLAYACRHHTDGKLTGNPTIGVCWDADRLDLGRAGTQPKPEYMSTVAGRKAATSFNKVFLTCDTQGGLEAAISLIDAPSRLEATGLFAGGMTASLVNKLMKNYCGGGPGQIVIEAALEIARRERYPHYPCRQSCLFAVENWEQMKQVSKYMMRSEGMHGPVYEVRGEAFGPFDGCIPYFAIHTTDARDRAELYWSGMRTNQPVLEWLIEAPISIGRCVGSI